jgi:hypothetical protein
MGSGSVADPPAGDSVKGRKSADGGNAGLGGGASGPKESSADMLGERPHSMSSRWGSIGGLLRLVPQGSSRGAVWGPMGFSPLWDGGWSETDGEDADEATAERGGGRGWERRPVGGGGGRSQLEDWLWFQPTGVFWPRDGGSISGAGRL